MMAKMSMAALTAALVLAFVPAAPAAPMTVYITTNETIGTLPPKPVIVTIGYADASHSVAFSPTVGFNGSSSDPSLINTYNSSMLNVTGGTLTELTAYDSSTMNISGGLASGTISADDNATLNITGGNEESVFANGSSTVNFSDASTGALEAVGGTVNMTSGTVGYAYLGAGTFNLEGGSITGPENMQIGYASGTLNVYGSGLSFFPSSAPPLDGSYSVIGISGTLLDGSTLNVNVEYTTSIGYDINLINVPEPSTFVLALIASVVGIGCAARRRFRSF